VAAVVEGGNVRDEEKWIVLSIVVLIVLAAVGFFHTKDEFRRVCDEARGTTVFDGRQYQCVKP
jgi:hypothetical protein